MRDSVYVPAAISGPETVEAVDTLCAAVSEATGTPYMLVKERLCRLLGYLCAEKNGKDSRADSRECVLY